MLSYAVKAYLNAKARREYFEQVAFWFHEQEKMGFAAEPDDVAKKLREQLQERLGEWMRAMPLFMKMSSRFFLN